MNINIVAALSAALAGCHASLPVSAIAKGPGANILLPLPCHDQAITVELSPGEQTMIEVANICGEADTGVVWASLLGRWKGALASSGFSIQGGQYEIQTPRGPVARIRFRRGEIRGDATIHSGESPELPALTLRLQVVDRSGRPVRWRIPPQTVYPLGSDFGSYLSEEPGYPPD